MTIDNTTLAGRKEMRRRCNRSPPPRRPTPFLSSQSHSCSCCAEMSCRLPVALLYWNKIRCESNTKISWRESRSWKGKSNNNPHVYLHIFAIRAEGQRFCVLGFKICTPSLKLFSPLDCKFQNMHWTFDPKNNLTSVNMGCGYCDCDSVSYLWSKGKCVPRLVECKIIDYCAKLLPFSPVAPSAVATYRNPEGTI